MVTHYILYDPSMMMFVAAGSRLMYTHKLNTAKHFSSEWAARTFRDRYTELECYSIKKIVHY